MILLDTHVLIWFAEDNSQLGKKATELADAALHVDEATVTAISFWEIAMLADKQRLRLELPAAALRRTVLKQGIREIPLTGEIAIAAAQIRNFHGDPADRMIVASALSIGAQLLTADKSILRWKGPLRTHDARR